MHSSSGNRMDISKKTTRPYLRDFSVPLSYAITYRYYPHVVQSEAIDRTRLVESSLASCFKFKQLTYPASTSPARFIVPYYRKGHCLFSVIVGHDPTALGTILRKLLFFFFKIFYAKIINFAFINAVPIFPFTYPFH